MLELARSGGNSRSDGGRPVASSRVCLLSVGQESLAVDLGHVCEVFRLEWVTPVPGMPPAVAGVANLRGTVIPLADLRPLLGMPRNTAPKYAAVVRQGGRQIGILVDEVPEIRTLQPEDVIDASPCEMTSNHPFLSGLLKMGSRASGFVEVSKLVALVEGTVDQQRLEFVSDGDQADSNEQAVIVGRPPTALDGKDGCHGKA